MCLQPDERTLILCSLTDKATVIVDCFIPSQPLTEKLGEKLSIEQNCVFWVFWIFDLESLILGGSPPSLISHFCIIFSFFWHSNYIYLVHIFLHWCFFFLPLSLFPSLVAMQPIFSWSLHPYWLHFPLLGEKRNPHGAGVGGSGFNVLAKSFPLWSEAISQVMVSLSIFHKNYFSLSSRSIKCMICKVQEQIKYPVGMKIRMCFLWVGDWRGSDEILRPNEMFYTPDRVLKVMNETQDL